MSARELARAQRMHADATASHTTAEAKVQTILDKLDTARFKRDDVSQKRVAGLIEPDSDRAYAALSGDIAVLERMLTQARAELTVKAENLQSVSACLATETAAHARQQDQVEYEATLAKVREIEAVFCKAIRAVALAGQKIGRSTLGQSFQKCDTLHRAFDLNLVPPESV